MKTALAVLLATLSFSVMAKDVYVDGYNRKDGTYVEPHHRSSPDSSKNNNYGTEGNYNPYTGKEGTKSPYETPDYGTKKGREGKGGGFK